MMVRIFPILAPDTLVVVAYIGGITAIFAALIAITQNDIKRVLAYSTVSQLGYMIMSVGTGAYVAAFFHLITHAVFKANLFYGAGSVIHGMHGALHELGDHDTDAQDMRNMGGLKAKMPKTYWSMLASTLALSGIPFFSGFLSKDAILAGTFSFASQHPQHMLLPIFGFGAAFITAFYMFRLIFMTFYNDPVKPKIYEHIKESPSEMTIPLMTLGVMSLFIFYTLPQLNPFSDAGWFKSLIHARDSLIPGGVNPTAHAIEEGIHHSHIPAMIISMTVAFLGIVLAWAMYYTRRISATRMAQRFPRLYQLSYNKFYIDELYGRFIYDPLLKLADWIAILDWDLYDKYVINGFGRLTVWIAAKIGIVDYDGIDQTLVDGVGRTTRRIGYGLKFVQTGRLQNYVLFALIGVVVIMIIQVL